MAVAYRFGRHIRPFAHPVGRFAPELWSMAILPYIIILKRFHY
jgi:hypothetical protein